MGNLFVREPHFCANIAHICFKRNFLFQKNKKKLQTGASRL